MNKASFEPAGRCPLGGTVPDDGTIPCDFEKSPLVGVIGTDAEHPPKLRAHLLTPEDMETLRRWIAAEPAAPRDP